MDAEIDDNVSTSSALSSRRLTARRGLIVYFVFLIIFSALANWFWITIDNPFGVFFLMWSPGTAALLTRLILHENWSDISFRLAPYAISGSVRRRHCPLRATSHAILPDGPASSVDKVSDGRKTWRVLIVAATLPFAVALIAYGCAWMIGLAHLVAFHPSMSLNVGIAFLGGQLSWWMIALLVVAFLVAEVVSAAGEEIGWRGYMLTRLIDAGTPRPVLVSGLIWSFWHWPSIFFDAKHLSLSLFLSACIFVVTITCLGSLAARLRLQTGSIWPSIVLHATWNICILELFNAVTSNSDTSYWIGESGILVALVMGAMVCVFWYNPWRVRHTMD